MDKAKLAFLNDSVEALSKRMDSAAYSSKEAGRKRDISRLKRLIEDGERSPEAKKELARLEKEERGDADDGKKSAREMSLEEIKKELSGGFGSGVSKERRQALNTARSEKEARGDSAKADADKYDKPFLEGKLKKLEKELEEDDGRNKTAIKADIEKVKKDIKAL